MRPAEPVVPARGVAYSFQRQTSQSFDGGPLRRVMRRDCAKCWMLVSPRGVTFLAGAGGGTLIGMQGSAVATAGGVRIAVVGRGYGELKARTSPWTLPTESTRSRVSLRDRSSVVVVTSPSTQVPSPSRRSKLASMCRWRSRWRRPSPVHVDRSPRGITRV
jgi:hypothetical protein